MRRIVHSASASAAPWESMGVAVGSELCAPGFPGTRTVVVRKRVSGYGGEHAVAECIHGFDDGMCDICFPRVAPEPVAVVATTATKTAPRSTRVTATRRASKRAPGAPAGLPPKVPPFATRRLYHVTPLTNLESILLDGELHSVASGFEPELDVAAPLARQLRAHADIGDGRHVDEFVPFSVSPDNERWVELRQGAEQPHWSAAARALTAADYAVLVAVGRDLGPDLIAFAATPPRRARASRSATPRRRSRRPRAWTPSSRRSRCSRRTPCRCRRSR
jgi:hypothetical protein